MTDRVLIYFYELMSLSVMVVFFSKVFGSECKIKVRTNQLVYYYNN